MGTIHHHVAVATFMDLPRYVEKNAEAFARVKEFAEEKRDVALGTDYSRLLIGPVSGVMNGYMSYIMVPDGSKEWWSTSDDANAVRDKFVEEFSPNAEVFVGSWGELSTTADFANGDNEAY